VRELSPHLLFGLGVVDVAYRDGEGVGGVGWFGRFGQVEQARYHELDLLFGGQAVTDNGTLDGKWSIFGDKQTATGRGHHRDAAHLPELECALCIGRKKDFLNRHDFGLP